LDASLVQAWRLPSELIAVREARQHVADACQDLPVETVDDARLLVTELVANALTHGSGAVHLVVARDAEGGLRVEVLDEGLDLPAVAEPRSLPERGSGLRLVEALASSWGVAPRTGGQVGKRVWFTLT